MITSDVEGASAPFCNAPFVLDLFDLSVQHGIQSVARNFFDLLRALLACGSKNDKLAMDADASR